MSDILRPAAEEGNIDLLYTILKNNRSILEDIDSEQLVETPLHIAASKGHIPFAIEIMNLKPSFALKLNPEGLSPIHLAIGNKKMVLSFVGMNEDLVRVKGKRGWTLLHLASKSGDVGILAELLRACPDSIEDVTVMGETALHIAARNNNYDALHFLVYFLRKNKERGAEMLECKILNQKDELDNTILHISAERKHPKEIIQLLIKTNIKLNEKNLDNKTALDMATGEKIIKLLSTVGAKHSSKLVTDSQTLDSKNKWMITKWDEMEIRISRIKSNISDEQRSTLMIIVTLIVTATYQSALSPSGGIYQANASDNNLNITSSNSTISSLGNAGKSVLSAPDFFWFSNFSMLSFFMSIITMIILAPRGKITILISYNPIFWFTISYLYSMWMISPTNLNSMIVSIFYYLVVYVLSFIITLSVYSKLQLRLNAWKLNRSAALLQSNTEIDTNKLTVEIGERNRNEGLSPDI